MADISKITLPNNNQYDIKDNIARGQIENLQDELENKVDKIAGKSLSTNDYTTIEKDKLANIESEANKTIIDSALSSISENPLQNKIINIALSEKLGISGDSKNNITTFTTDDAADSTVTQATGWSTVAALTSGVTHANLFNRISKMMKNVRWLYKTLSTFGSIKTGSNNSSSISVPNGQQTMVNSIVLNPGRWIIIAGIDWAANGEGYRQITIQNTSDVPSVNPARQNAATTLGLAGKQTYQQIIRYINNAEENTIFIYAYHNASQAITTSSYCYAIRLGNDV